MNVARGMVIGRECDCNEEVDSGRKRGAKRRENLGQQSSHHMIEISVDILHVETAEVLSKVSVSPSFASFSTFDRDHPRLTITYGLGNGSESGHLDCCR